MRPGVDEAEVVRGDRGQQRHPDVGRRRAVRDRQFRNDLDVVRRKRVTSGPANVSSYRQVLSATDSKFAVLGAKHRGALGGRLSARNQRAAAQSAMGTDMARARRADRRDQGHARIPRAGSRPSPA